ncbi:Minichromosome maintenance domain-containing protein 2 [Desmophyllum pertusum]|uniref:Minichromosome maintenance domain-containing protein 2 n=1 Tax=Desmophyllum pertusum TaxID=174260 RepID=A0A9W9YTZ4_9CNID|nr:Minichromosome maintenance domain-containing protein 2 [Desmophyllum pertusum]
MDEKSILEVAFEWLCECGAFDQLRKQCECYTTDLAEKTVYRFVLEMDLMHLLDFNATLGNLVITEPLNAINVIQEVCYVIIHTLSWIPDLLFPSQVLAVVRFSSVSPHQECVSSKNLSGHGQPNLVKIVGIVSGITAVTQYTQSARFYCPQSQCFGSAKYCYIRVHLAGKTEDVTVRSDFVCRYCGRPLIEDVTCRTLADKCIVQVISPLTVDKKLWMNTTDNGKFFQAIPIYVRDELIKEVQIGCYFSFVVLPSCEIHDSSLHFQCTPVFEANNIEKISPSPFLSLLPANIPERIEMLHKDREDSPWSFVASLAYCFGGCVTPPGTFFQLKMFMLMCLLLLHSSDSSEDAKQIHSKNLHLLVIADDLLRIQRLLLYGASFAKRMLVYSPISELFPSCSRDPFGSGTCMVSAGCISLATDGICVIPNATVLKKDQKDKLQNALENGSITMKVPEKYWAYQGHQLSLPLTCSLWACSEPVQKTSHQAVLDPMVNLSNTIKDCPTLPRAFIDQFSLVFNLSGSAEHVDNSDESVSEEVLRKAMECPQDEASLYISDEEMSQFLHYAGHQHVSLTVAAQDLIQGYYLASRRTRNSQSTGGTDFPASALQTLTSLAIAHAKLALRSEWLAKPNRTIFVAQYGDKLVGLRAIHIVDEGKTFISQGLRIHPRFRGLGLSTRLIDAIHEFIRLEYPDVCRERFTTKSDNIERLAIQKKYGDTALFDRDILAFYVNRETLKPQQLEEVAGNLI